MPLRPIAPAALLLTLAALPLPAQVVVVEGPIPEEVRESALAFLNAPETLRLPGTTRVPAEIRIEGNLAILGGSLHLAGAVGGDVLVVNGDLTLLPGGRVGGQVLVLGGRISGEAAAALGPEARAYPAPFRYQVRRGRVEPAPTEGFTPGFLSTDLGFGQARFTLRAGPNYNRVEGLGVRVGPVIETVGSNPLALEAFGIWRSVSGLSLDSDRLGYAFRLEQALGGRGTLFTGVTAESEVIPVEDRGLSNAEASLATFFLRRDFRDYYEREGWSAYLRVRPVRLRLEASLGYREEEHATPPLRRPWTLRGDADDPWRPLPLVAEGPLRSLEADLRWDSRDDPSLPSDGWLLDLALRRQVGGALRFPASDPAEPPEDGVPAAAAGNLPFFTWGSMDLRRYARVGPTSRLNLRLQAGGSLSGRPLPPQLQGAPGGEGTLPGHPSFSVDCGARASVRAAPVGEDEENPLQLVFPGYGCDRTALFQAEFQGAFPLDLDPVPDRWDDSELAALFDLAPRWALFFNAGRGWSRGELVDGVPRGHSPTRADVGMGIFIGSVGLYWAHPLNRRDRGVNFFIRFHQRF